MRLVAPYLVEPPSYISGGACVSMGGSALFRCAGREVPPEKLAAKIGANGSNLGRLLDASVDYDVDCELAQIPIDQVAESAPCVVPTCDGGHVALLERVVGDVAWIVDNACRDARMLEGFLRNIDEEVVLVGADGIDEWRAWAVATVPGRACRLGLDAPLIAELAARAQAADGFRAWADLDAALRMVAGERRAGLIRGAELVPRLLQLVGNAALISPDAKGFTFCGDLGLVRGTRVLRLRRPDLAPTPWVARARASVRLAHH